MFLYSLTSGFLTNVHSLPGAVISLPLTPGPLVSRGLWFIDPYTVHARLVSVHGVTEGPVRVCSLRNINFAVAIFKCLVYISLVCYIKKCSHAIHLYHIEFSWDLKEL